MDVKKIALLVGALIIAAATAFMARSLIQGSSAPVAQAAVVAPQPDGPMVLVATKTLPIGTIIDAGSFRFQPWPKELMQAQYFVKDEKMDPTQLVGRVVRFAVTAGQPVTQDSLVKPGDRGFLAAALGPGMRAVTVSVSQSSGVAGFIFPGDRVDLMVTQEIRGSGDDSAPLRTSETFVRNLRVLATDQRTDGTDKDGKAKVETFQTVTLEATPKIAEKIAVAQSVGTLSLSLRSIADNAAELERAIAAGEVSVPQNGDAKAEKQMMIQVASRPIDTGGTYVTGADVSRFQRSSVPSRNASSAGAAAGGAAAASFSGPVVRVARGNEVTVVPVGGK
ncbi:MAG: Flp pilus assembly protein CpaB [Sphingomonas sanxanigenens]|uniref:Flp pilus assembly protein CpaB n=1 Tax=Sphingomonas sanxanigenens TaxID=397260 RepID=A0A2W5BY03_9SPHN|nr:MAG: Flp pilus assembly protein CpaB [Sphingomonas sanxanigenens]